MLRASGSYGPAQEAKEPVCVREVLSTDKTFPVMEVRRLSKSWT